jgi:hypothetical protein
MKVFHRQKDKTKEFAKVNKEGMISKTNRNREY